MTTRTDAITSLFLASSPAAYRRAFIALTLFVLLTFAACLALGCSHQAIFPCDAAIHLEGGWRLYQGQRPHTDYYSPLGVVPQLVTVSGMWLLGPDDRALQTGYTLLLPLASLAAWLLLRRRLPAFPAFLYAALLGVMLVGTRPLNGAYWFASYAMQYNRLGWVLFCLLAVTLLVPPRSPRSVGQEWRESIFAGIVLSLLAFAKVNYLVIGVALTGAAVVLFRPGLRLLLGLLLGGAATTLALLAYLHFDLAAMVGDLRMLSGVQKLPARFAELSEVAIRNGAWLGLLALLIVLLHQKQPGEEPDKRGFPWMRWQLAALGLLAFGVVINSANSQQLDIPTFGLAALMLAEGFRRRLTDTEDLPAEARRPYLMASLAGTCLVGMILGTDVASIANSVVWPYRSAEVAAAEPLQSDRLPHLLMRQIEDDREESRAPEDAMLQLPVGEEKVFTAYQYGYWFNDGIALLRRHCRPDDRLVVFDWINPFTFALGLSSPRGDALWWHHGRVMDDEHHPPAEQILQEATLVIVPKRGYQPGDTAFLLRHCSPILDADFQKLGETRLWALYGRRTRPAGGK